MEPTKTFIKAKRISTCPPSGELLDRLLQTPRGAELFGVQSYLDFVHNTRRVSFCAVYTDFSNII